MNPELREKALRVPYGDRYVWFDLGTIDRRASTNVQKLIDATYLPFPRIAVGGRSNGSIYIIFLFLASEDGVGVAMTSEDGTSIAPVTLFRRDEERGLVRETFDVCPLKGEDLDMAYQAALVFLEVLAEAQTPTTGYKLTPNPKNPQRIKRGKKPLYDWTTVVITPRAPKGEHRGGTHASPRPHDRRGHWATSKLGKRYWRRPARVGNPANGFVFHDYLVKGTNEPAHTT